MLSRSVVLAAAAALLPHAAHADTQLAGTVELFEMHLGAGHEHFLFDSTFSASGERHGATLLVEGGSDVGAHVDEVTAHALYTFAPGDSTSLLLGVRHDFRSGGDLTHAAFGAQWQVTQALSAEHYLWLSENGKITGSAEVVASLPLTDTLTLEPRASLGWAGQAIPAEEIGAGVGAVELSARLRRSIGPVFNVYGGVIHERLVGETRDIAQAQGNAGHVTRAVIGLGLNF